MPAGYEKILFQLKEERLLRGMTQAELAKAANLPQSVIARMETGKAVPQLDTILKVLAPLGKTLSVVSVTEKSEDGQ